MNKFIIVFLLALAGSLGSFTHAAAAPAVSPGHLIPRTPVVQGARYELAADSRVTRVVVKFHEGSHVRLRNAALTPLARDARQQAALAARGLTEARLRQDLATVYRLVAQEPLARGIERLFTQDEAVLAERRASGEAKSGRELADLDLYFQISLPPESTYAEVARLVARLAALPSVETAYAEPEYQEPQTTATQGDQGI